MAIYLPPMPSPMVWTDQSRQAYTKLHRAEMDYIAAYHKTLTLLGLFSPRKHRALREAGQAYRQSRNEYVEAAFGK